MKREGVRAFVDRVKQEMIGGDVVSIEGGRRALIRRCRSIEAYGEDLVRVRVGGGGCVAVWGCALTMRSFRGDSILVEGRIARVEMEEVER